MGEKPSGGQRNGCETSESNNCELPSAMASLLGKCILYPEMEPYLFINSIWELIVFGSQDRLKRCRHTEKFCAVDCLRSGGTMRFLSGPRNTGPALYPPQGARVSICCGEERAELKGEALDLLVNLRSYPHLWP